MILSYLPLLCLKFLSLKSDTRPNHSVMTVNKDVFPSKERWRVLTIMVGQIFPPFTLAHIFIGIEVFDQPPTWPKQGRPFKGLENRVEIRLPITRFF